MTEKLISPVANRAALEAMIAAGTVYEQSVFFVVAEKLIYYRGEYYAAGGGGGGAVNHDITLSGDGSTANPLTVAGTEIRPIAEPTPGLNDLGLVLSAGADFDAAAAWTVNGQSGSISKTANGATVLAITGQPNVTLLDAAGVWQPATEYVVAEGMGHWTSFPRAGTPGLIYSRWITNRVLDDGMGQLGQLKDLNGLNNTPVLRHLVGYINELIRRDTITEVGSSGSTTPLAFDALSTLIAAGSYLSVHVYPTNAGNSTGCDLIGLIWHKDASTIFGLFFDTANSGKAFNFAATYGGSSTFTPLGGIADVPTDVGTYTRERLANGTTQWTAQERKVVRTVKIGTQDSPTIPVLGEMQNAWQSMQWVDTNNDTFCTPTLINEPQFADAGVQGDGLRVVTGTRLAYINNSANERVALFSINDMPTGDYVFSILANQSWFEELMNRPLYYISINGVTTTFGGTVADIQNNFTKESKSPILHVNNGDSVIVLFRTDKEGSQQSSMNYLIIEQLA